MSIDCNLCKCLVEGEVVTIGTTGAITIVGTIINVSCDCQKITLGATAFTIGGLVFPIPTDLIPAPIVVCCTEIEFLVKSDLLIPL